MQRLLLKPLGLLCLLGGMLYAQETATLAGVVTDASDAVVPDAQISLVDIHRGTIRTTDTNAVGGYFFNTLQPGEYMLEATKSGFNKLRLERVVVNARDRQTLPLRLEVSGLAPVVVDVEAQTEGVSTDTSTGTSLGHDYTQNLPVNGRTTQALIQMAPGVINASGGSGTDGELNVNGLRSNANYYTLDGVSVNRTNSTSGTSSSSRFGGGGGGPFGARSNTSDGSSQQQTIGMSALSLDALQEVRVQTSTFAPEFGRTPGAQISMTSRGGTNQYHGLLFDYLRNTVTDANDWFANSSGYSRGGTHENRPGGTFGGPITRDKTFFFASYELLKLTAPQTSTTTVPDAAARAAAPAAMQPYINAFPVANGPELGDNVAKFTAITSNPTTTHAGSGRVDHVFNDSQNIFVRYSLNQSDGVSRGTQTSSPNTVYDNWMRSQNVTGSWISILNPNSTNDLRASFSSYTFRNSSAMDSFGGAVPLTDSLVFPSGVTSADGGFNLNILGAGGYSYGQKTNNTQKQINVVDSITAIAGNHQYKFGIDYRRTMLTVAPTNYSSSVTFAGLNDDDGGFYSGTTIAATVSSMVKKVYPEYTNFSLFAQDAWKATPRLTITYGVRWDVNPAPGVSKGDKPFGQCSSGPCTITQNVPLYDTRWGDIAPRFGFAYNFRNTPGHETVLRFGFGVFYDANYGSLMSAFTGAPYANTKTLPEAVFPLTTSDASAPGLPATKPYGMIATADRQLKSPLVKQYNLTLEHYFGRSQSLSLSYVGTAGSRLLQVQSQPKFSTDYIVLTTTTNAATSSYNGLQAQFRRRLNQSLQMQASYTWSHSIDSSSSESAAAGGFATLLGDERGNSNFDVRHNLNVSASYQLPHTRQRWVGKIANDWYLDGVFSARTGLPFDVRSLSLVDSSTAEDSTGPRGLFAIIRPDYTGQALWITDSSAPGGKRLNPDAFSLPSTYQQGSLPRNAIRGFGMAQLDFALRRQIPITEKVRFQITAQAFNVFNHANFANPLSDLGGNLASPLFGLVTQMLNSSASGGMNSLYSNGGPRSMELALRLQF